MSALPRLIEEDIQRLDTSLLELLRQTNASVALVTDRAGFVIACQGETKDIDTVTLGALGANTYAASAAIDWCELVNVIHLQESDLRSALFFRLSCDRKNGEQQKDSRTNRSSQTPFT